MLNFTHLNHLKYYFDDNLFGSRTSPFQRYHFEFGKIDIDHYRRSNFADELKRVANLVHQDLGSEKVALLSGGLDSEIMVRNFLSIGIKPRCVTYRFENGYNDYEVAAAQELTKSLGLKHEIIDFNVFDFYNSGESLEIAKKYSCNVFAFSVFFKVAKILSAPCIIAGELQLNKIRDDNNNPIWVIRMMEDLDTAHIRFSNDTGIPFIQEWFSYTPEVMLYYLETPEIKKLVSTPSYYQTILPVKNRILKKYLPDVFDKKKNTGYDKLSALSIEGNQLLSENMPYRINDDPCITYDKLVEMLKGEQL